jgi:hypothetical protein
MLTPPKEPTNLVLEQFRQMRAESNARFENIDARFDKLSAEIVEIKRDIRGLKLNTIAEICKANLTVASFADHERRIQALEKPSAP